MGVGFNNGFLIPQNGEFAMLQMTSLNHQVLQTTFSKGLDYQWNSMQELENLSNEHISNLRKNRSEVAKTQPPWIRAQETIDRFIRTDEIEYMDDPNFPESKKITLVRKLHHLNIALRSYHRFLKILKPHILEVEKKYNRPARVLELASGSGEFALALASLAEKKKLPVEITGSDIVESYVHEGNAKAEKKGIPAKFVHLNAFDMSTVKDNEYDIVFTAQSIHHFTPGQLAMMIAQSQRITTSTFIGVDGYRGFLLLGVMPGVMTTLSLGLLHDGIVSARKAGEI